MSRSAIFEYAARLTQQMLHDYRLVEELEYDVAEHVTKGNMFVASVHRGQDLFKSPNLTKKFGTPELLEHLEKKPRTTRHEFEKQWLDNYLGEY